MVIQHNISAINSHRNLGINNSATSKNLEKLSSGYRINRAGDDAAGLAISEKMRGQIRGLAMAEQNASNGVSLIQTAEGGLNETHAILQRMRELSVQSSNGTYTDEDRAQLDLEFQAVKSEIDRIASSTHYNGIKLLDGTTGGTSSLNAVGSTATVKGSQLAISEELENLGFGSGAAVDITSFNDAFNGQNATITVVGTGSDARVALQVGDKTYYGALDDGTTTHNFADGTTAATLTADTYAFFDQDGNVVATMTNDVSGTLTALDTGKNGSITGIALEDNGTATSLTDGSDDTAAIDDTHAMYGAMIGSDKSELIFQIGANGGADQRVGLHVGNMSSGALGTDDMSVAQLNLKTVDNANKAIDVLEASINQVSSQRAGLGALQNRLEHTINNLGVTKENLTAAESTIRDVDMAKEMMEFTKNNILVQASQAMLAQANQLPQGVLSLLR